MLSLNVTVKVSPDVVGDSAMLTPDIAPGWPDPTVAVAAAVITGTAPTPTPRPIFKAALKSGRFP